MNESGIIVSEYYWASIVKLFVYYSYKALFALFFALVLIKGMDLSLQLLAAGLTAGSIYILYINVYQGGIVKKIMIGPKHLKIDYWFKGVERIEYTDITAIKNLRNRTRSGDPTGNLRQEIILSNGEIIYYSETEFVNYEEMKKAIWNYRLEAFSRLRQAEILE